MSNVLGTANLLEWIKQNHKDKRVIIFSTDEVFGPAPEGYFFKEDDKHKPSNPYAASKSGQEAIAYSLAKSFDLDLIITRCMNVYGERQNPEKFVPKTIKAILNDEKVILHGKNKQDISSRCWIHARNVSEAILFILDNGESKESYHIIGQERSVYDIANTLNKVLRGKALEDKQIEFIDFHAARPGHDKRYALDGSKLGWYSPMTIEETLETTAKWYLRSEENMKWLN
jgi:dTDP-glucose 4,6-dehydratase